jgi:hypothetical protein
MARTSIGGPPSELVDHSRTDDKGIRTRHQAVTTLEQALKLKEGVRSALTR